MAGAEFPVTLKLKVDSSGLGNLRSALGGSLTEGMRKGIGFTGGGDNKEAKKQTGLLEKIGKGFGTMGVFGLMAYGIQKLTSVTQSMFRYSPAMTQSLKLLETSFYLIMKPIGDFIGMILKPVMIWLLKFIIANKGLMQVLGAIAGTLILIKIATTAFGIISGGISTIVGAFSAGGIFSNIYKGITDLASNIATKLSPMLSSLSSSITSGLSGVVSGLGGFLAGLGGGSALVGGGILAAAGVIGIAIGQGIDRALGGGIYALPKAGGKELKYLTALQAATWKEPHFKVGEEWEAPPKESEVRAKIRAYGGEADVKKYDAIISGTSDSFDAVSTSVKEFIGQIEIGETEFGYTSESVVSFGERVSEVSEDLKTGFDSLTTTVNLFGYTVTNWGKMLSDAGGAAWEFGKSCSANTQWLTSFTGALADTGAQIMGKTTVTSAKRTSAAAAKARKSGGNWRSYMQGGGMVGQEGEYYLHQGEYVMPAYRGNSTTNNTAPIYITANVRSDMDIDRLARQISQHDFQRTRRY